MSNFAGSNANLSAKMVSKTRERLIEVAKQLFAYKGVENTTMNDIAAASEKGRRTIYTYFKNKREIYNAVVEQQSNQIIERLRAIVDDETTNATEKLRSYILELFDIISQTSPKREGYRRLLVRDHKRLSKIFKVALDKERALFRKLIDMGVRDGEFDALQVERLPSLISLNMGAGDFMHQDETTAVSEEQQIQNIKNITEFVVAGVTVARNDNQHNT